MNAFYEAFATSDPFTGLLQNWMGTATLETIRWHGLIPDLSYENYDDARKYPDGWACKSQANRF